MKKIHRYVILCWLVIGVVWAKAPVRIFVEAEDLLKALAVDEGDKGVKIYDWELVKGTPNPILWDESGNSWSERGFERRGELYLTNKGKITHHLVRERVMEGKWKLFFLGDKDRIRQVKLSPDAVTQENPTLQIDKLYIREKYICGEHNGSKITIYGIKFPKKRLFWMEENLTTDPRGSAGYYTIYYDQKPLCPVVKKMKKTAIPTSPTQTEESKQPQATPQVEERYSIRIHTQPSDAKIDITNIKELFHQGMQLPEGRYYVEITRAGYRTYKSVYLLDKDSVFDVVLQKEGVSDKTNVADLETNRPEQNSRYERVETDAGLIEIYYPRSVSAGSLFFMKLTMTNYMSESCRGGLGVSFPQYENAEVIQSVNHDGFFSLHSYESGSSIYNRLYQTATTSRYLLVEGWSKQWEPYDEKSIIFTLIAPAEKDQLHIYVRGVLVCNGRERVLPHSGIRGQQGYENYLLKIPLIHQSGASRRDVSDSPDVYEAGQMDGVDFILNYFEKIKHIPYEQSWAMLSERMRDSGTFGKYVEWWDHTVRRVSVLHVTEISDLTVMVKLIYEMRDGRHICAMETFELITDSGNWQIDNQVTENCI